MFLWILINPKHFVVSFLTIVFDMKEIIFFFASDKPN